MKKIIVPAIALATFPSVTFAQVGSLQNVFANIVIFTDSTLIPFLFGIAFLFFAVNVVRYFVIGAGNSDAQDSAKSLAIYGVAAFVFIIIFWGVVNLLVSTTGLENQPPVQSDYLSGNHGGVAGQSDNEALTSPGNDTEDLDLSVDNITAGNDVSSTDSPASCISFNVDGTCADAVNIDLSLPLSNDDDDRLPGRRLMALLEPNGDTNIYYLVRSEESPRATTYLIRSNLTGNTILIEATENSDGQNIRLTTNVDTAAERSIIMTTRYSESRGGLEVVVSGSGRNVTGLITAIDQHSFTATWTDGTRTWTEQNTFDGIRRYLSN